MQSILVRNAKLHLVLPVSTSANLLHPVKHVLLVHRRRQGPIHVNVPIVTLALVMVTDSFVPTRRVALVL